MAGGAAGSAVAMPVQSLGNAGYFGDPLLSPEEYLTGVAVGAVVGGAVNGSIAALKGNNFWNGQLRSSGLPRPQLLPARINAELPKAELAGQSVKSLAPDIPSGQTMVPLQRQVIPFNAEMGGVNAVETGIKTVNGIKVSGFARHGLNRIIERGVKPVAILDAIKDPLKIGNVITDQLGRQSQRFIGRFAEVVVNPQTGQIISVNPTSSSKVASFLKLIK